MLINYIEKCVRMFVQDPPIVSEEKLQLKVHDDSENILKIN